MLEITNHKFQVECHLEELDKILGHAALSSQYVFMGYMLFILIIFVTSFDNYSISVVVSI